jgi:predicted AAA+ superfamily ATPase
MNFKRNIYPALVQDSQNPKIIILMGARQVGKTYLMKKLANELKNYRYFNLEFSEQLLLFNGSENEIIQLLKSSGQYIFIDEFHYLENISKIFKAIYDESSWSNHSVKIYASGSSALEMHKHLEESLGGRLKKYWIKPLSYKEFCSNSEIKSELSEFLCYGALPGTYDLKQHPTNKDRQQYLQEILNAYIQKEVKFLIVEENIVAFNHLLYILADKQGQITSTASLANEIKVTAATVEKYISILEQTFVLYSLKSFSGNLSNELKKSKKYYYYDLGVRNALIKDFSSLTNRADKGCILETFTYHYLLNIADDSDTEIFFWRTSDGMEIDFIWNRNRIPYPIEVKSSLRKPEVFPALIKFLKAYPKAPFAVVLNDKVDEEIFHKDHKIYFISFKNIDYLEELLN